uniref:Uncharacterized protein n=1 Tax=Panagrolaimus sp. ES5 TaxID=591445 RepID=A0AC34GFS8_9BILA
MYTRFNKDEYDDAIILCLIGHENFESIGIYDTNELSDALAMEIIEAVPNSVINPFGVEEYEGNDEPACYDFNGFPTVSFLCFEVLIGNFHVD